MKTKFAKVYNVQDGTLKIVLELPDGTGNMDKKKLRNILGDIASKSRNFYLWVGNELKINIKGDE